MQPRRIKAVSQVEQQNAWKQTIAKLLPIFESAMYVANNVLAFDTHRTLIQAGGDLELLWSFQKGDITGSSMNDERSRQEEYLRILLDEDDVALPRPVAGPKGVVVEQPRAARAFVEKHRCYCQVLLKIPLPDEDAASERSTNPPEGKVAPGLLSISRRIDATGERGSRYTEIEKHHLKQVATLMEAAFGDPAAHQLLEYLRLNFEHQRKHLEGASQREVMEEYMLKAGRALHGCPGKYFDPRRARGDLWREALRPTVKMVGEEGERLALTACLSTRPGEWGEPDSATGRPRREYTYDLLGRVTSIAAKVYRGKKGAAFCTNRYQSFPSKVDLFPDTHCHVAAPIVDRNGHRLGVLSIETDARDHYTPAHVAALTLLAASAHAPLKRALSQINLSTKLNVLSDDLIALSHETRLVRFQEYLEKTLRPTYRVVNCTAGDPESSRGWTTKKVATNNPMGFNPLNTVSVFNVPDAHGVPLWRTKLQRRDDKRFVVEDRQIVEEYCRRLTTMFEATRQTEFERLWDQEVVKLGFSDFEHILKRFGHLLCESDHKVIRRCRVYRLNRSKAGKKSFVLHAEFGPDQAGNRQPQTNREDLLILDHHTPVLFLNHGVRTTLPGNSEEFKVVPDGLDSHGHRERTQWVEVAIRHNHRAYKIVFDHANAPVDAFTIWEMRLIASLTRSLSAAIKLAEAYRAVASLAIEGLYVDLLTHHHEKIPDTLKSQLKKLAKYPASKKERTELERTIKKLSQSLDIFRAFDEGAAPTLDKILAEAVDACQYLVEERYQSVSLRHDPFPPALRFRSVRDPRSLFILLVTLIENACKFVGKKAARDATHRGTVVVRVDVGKGREAGTVRIEVCDNGVGLTPAKAAALREKFATPERYLDSAAPKKDGVGLVLAAFLAKRWNWTLSVDDARPDGQTVFRIAVTAVAARRKES